MNKEPINIDTILLKHLRPVNYAHINLDLKAIPDLKAAIKEIVEEAIDRAAENAETKDITTSNCDDHTPYWGACVSCGRVDNPDVIIGSEIDKQSILNIKEEIVYE